MKSPTAGLTSQAAGVTTLKSGTSATTKLGQPAAGPTQISGVAPTVAGGSTLTSLISTTAKSGVLASASTTSINGVSVTLAPSGGGTTVFGAAGVTTSGTTQSTGLTQKAAGTTAGSISNPTSNVGISSAALTTQTTTSVKTSTAASTSTSSTVTTTSTTTTTTTRPPCLPYECKTNPANLNANGIVDTTKLQNAAFQQACDRLYVFSKNLQNWTNAASYCCSLGMQLLSIETKDELQCISDLMNSVDSTGLADEYFISGSDYQNASSFVWCSANFTPVDPNVVTWSTGEPSVTSFLGAEEDCVSVQLSSGVARKNVLRDVDCSVSKKFICELPVPPTTKPPCLAYTCEKNTTILDDDGLIKQNTAVDGALRVSTCGRMYYFSNAAGSFTTAASECCKLGMQLVSFETREEITCFNKILNTRGYGENLNFNAWTGASDQYHEGLFTWCTPNRLSNIVNNQFFPPGQPDNAGGGENCVHIYYAAGNIIQFNDATCTANVRFVCESVAPDCPFPQCPAYACIRDTAKNALSKAWKATVDGQFRSACGQQYFFSNYTLTYQEALAECCKYGLKLLSIEFNDELDCIKEMVIAEIRQHNFYWSSGTNLGYGCELTYGWCGSKTLAPNITWGVPIEPNVPLYERCLLLHTANNFSDQVCSQQRFFICEGNVPDCTATCPSYCVKDSSLFNSKDQLVNVASYGTWKTVGGKTYLYGSNLLDFYEAYDLCCRIGMSLVSVETNEEMQILLQMKNEISPDSTDEAWTSGSHIDCDYRFKWCGSGEKLLRNDSRWHAGQPNNAYGNQSCVRVMMTPTQISFNDLACEDKRTFFCEAPAVPVCTQVACSDMTCELDPMKYVQSLAWRDSTVGEFRSICGRQYILNKFELTYAQARVECCKMGMELLSLETLDEYNCFLNDPFNFGPTAYQLWTSAVSDGIGCENATRGWCPSLTPVPSGIPWAPGQPNNTLTEKCTYLELGRNIPVTLYGYNCESLRWFACEASIPECKPMCPIKTCSKDSTSFDKSGKLISPNQYGTWRDTCGRRYLFSSARADYYTAFKTCCSIGMQLLIIQDDAELQCITTLNDADTKFSDTYYTSGSSQDCRNRYEFCPDTGIYIYANDTRWQAGDCNQGEVSLYINLQPGAKTQFSDYFFNYTTRFICEGPII
ncbi:uncharacterized protein LOC132200629 [Neocloeon triangulifer]|uniref:uncharacterized protein LOC132200629 n=1 Tax=Neocloeon triangulifer TaxID=2078957 RepID=UPI00286F608E|nr:uncharacterized protein LOC132200629 [Neocloeon triangulifer]